jgi:hypothetical protein
MCSMGEKDEMNEGGVWMKRVSGRGICEWARGGRGWEYGTTL